MNVCHTISDRDTKMNKNSDIYEGFVRNCGKNSELNKGLEAENRCLSALKALKILRSEQLRVLIKV